MSVEIYFESELEKLEKAIVDRLKTCAMLRGIDIIDRNVGDVDDAIAEQLGNIGASIFVSEVELGGVVGDMANVSGDDSQFTVVVQSHPTTNTTGRSASALREIVMRRLHQWTPPVNGAGVITLLPDPENGRPNSKKKLNIRDLTFRISFTLEAGID